MDAIGIPMEEFRETDRCFIGPATEQKVLRLIGPGLLPQKGRQPSSCFGQEMAEMMEVQARQKDDRRKLLLKRPNGMRKRSGTIKPASPMQRAPPPE